MFQHTAARRRLDCFCYDLPWNKTFQHTAARRRLETIRPYLNRYGQFQHTAARRRLVVVRMYYRQLLLFQHTAARRRLGRSRQIVRQFGRFNTQPPEGGWVGMISLRVGARVVSTHSRPKAAGLLSDSIQSCLRICFNTQPPEGGWLVTCPFIA